MSGPEGAKSASPLVLVVDDDPLQTEILAEWLGSVGLRTAKAADGDEALDRIRAERPMLVITDMMMPNRDGIETVRDIKDRWPDIKVVAISSGMGAGSDPGIILRAARSMGADAALGKPLRRAAVLEMVGELLAGKAG